MAIIGSIILRMSADNGAFLATVGRSAAAIDEVTRSAERAQRAVGGVDLGGGSSSSSGSSGGSGDATDAALVGAVQVGAALRAALAPLEAIGGTIARQLNAVGGTITSTARLASATLKPLANEALMSSKRFANQAAADFARLSAKKPMSGLMSGLKSAGDGLTKLNATALPGPVGAFDKLRGAIAGATAGLRGYMAKNLEFQKQRESSGGFVSTISTHDLNAMDAGDVARKGLDKLSGVKLDGPVAAAAKFRGTLQSITPTAQSVTTSVRRMGAEIAVAFGAVAVVYKLASAVKGFVVDGVKGASDLNETITKTQFVFGSAASTITSAADEMAAKFGIVKQEFMDSAVSLGRFGKAAGLTQDASAAMGVDLAKLAVDLSSMENIGTGEAMTKLSSAISGSTEVLRRHGALLSEARVKQEALDRGWHKGKGELSEQTKVMARIALVYKDMSDASGDLERTQDGAANQMRKLSGSITNAATSIGQAFLPALTSGLNLLNEFITFAAGAFEANVATVAGWAESVGAAFATAGSFVRNYDLVLEIAGIKARELGANTIAVLAAMADNWGTISGYLRSNWFKMLADLVNSTRAMSENIDANLVGLFHSLQDFFSGKGFTFNWTPLLEGFKATADELPELLKPNLVSMQGEIDQAAERMAGRERDRAAAVQPRGPAAGKPTVPDFKPVAGPGKTGEDKYHGTAAAELGSKEAASSIARFRNGGDNVARDTAKNTRETAKATKNMAQALAEIAHRGGASTNLSAFTF